jgi:phage repressor protein C with HTH and peptisase S24 domain
MTVKDRIQQYIDYKGISIYRLEASAELSKGYWSKTKSISADVVMKISRIYTDISTDWLLRGEGEMLSHNNNEEDEPKISYTKGVPYYNVDFIGGFDLVLNDQTINPEYLIDFKKYNDATCWCNVTGHSMEPEINHGDMIALKKIEDKSFLPLGEVYAIVTTNDMRTIKRLAAGKTDDTYTLVPSNKSPEYSTQQLPTRMIKTIFQVLGAVKRF